MLDNRSVRAPKSQHERGRRTPHDDAPWLVKRTGLLLAADGCWECRDAGPPARLMHSLPAWNGLRQLLSIGHTLIRTHVRGAPKHVQHYADNCRRFFPLIICVRQFDAGRLISTHDLFGRARVNQCHTGFHKENTRCARGETRDMKDTDISNLKYSVLGPSSEKQCILRL